MLEVVSAAGQPMADEIHDLRGALAEIVQTWEVMVEEDAERCTGTDADWLAALAHGRSALDGTPPRNAREATDAE